MSVNPRLPEPETLPHTAYGVCLGCGAGYSTSHYGITFQQGVDYIRVQAAQWGDEGNGYRSRRPVLWAMHVLKLKAWYQEHSRCEVRK